VGSVFEFSAHHTLDQLQNAIGVPGMAAASVVPGLLAEVDQHAAAVRDILSVGVTGSAKASVLLAGYARGLLDVARELGWGFGEPTLAGWTRTDWLTVRLVAVCDLARREP
jgi:hypothetical protein